MADSAVFDRHVGDYQGYAVQAVDYRRSDGLRPDSGWVDLRLEDLGELTIGWKSVPWMPANGKEAPGQISLQAWASVVRATVDQKDPVDAPKPDKGLELFGELRLKSVLRDGTELPMMTYHHVYVESSGLEELNPDLHADAKSHSKGLVRVPLTDIRKYYPDYGALVCRINCKYPDGLWDEGSLIQAPGGVHRPATIREVMQYLFSQLPGSPIVVPSSSVFKANYVDDAAPSVVGEGEPVLGHLERFLEQLGLTPKYLPSGNYEVNTRGAADPGYGKYYEAPGSAKEIKKFQRTERKVGYLTDRPEFVQVFGKRVVRRITIPYIPVMMDEDGLWFPLRQIETRWNYPLDKLNAQVLNGREKNFRDVPPGDEDQVNEQKARRIELLRKYAYRAYLPAHLFAPLSGGDSSGVATGGGEQVRGIALDSWAVRSSFFLPLLPVAIYQSELGTLGTNAPLADGGGVGDREPYTLVQPLVRGCRVAESFFRRWKDVEDYFDDKQARALGELNDIERNLNSLIKDTGEYAKVFERAEDDFESAEGAVASTANTLFLTALEKVVQKKILRGRRSSSDLKFKLREDVSKALASFGVAVPFETLIRSMNGDSIDALNAVSEYVEARKALEEQRKKASENLETVVQQFETFARTYSSLGGIPARFSLPAGYLPGVSVDRNTGLVYVSGGEPLCRMKQAFVLHGDAADADGDGAVVVTAGYEVKDNSVSAITSVLFCVGNTDDPDKNGEPVCCGVNRASPLKCKIARAPSMRMYTDDQGVPMNRADCVQAAMGAAQGALGQPGAAVGYTYVLSGFHAAVLGGSTTSVTHHYDPKESALATTTILVNNPNGRTFDLAGGGSPIYRGNVAQRGQTDFRAMLENAKGL